MILTRTRKQERSTLTQLVQDNGYNASAVLHSLKKGTQRTRITNENPEHTWAKFTYIERETRMSTNIFKKSRFTIAFSTSNNLGKLLEHRNFQEPTDQFNSNGVYQLQCPTCDKRYIGQTDRSVRTRYKEHNRDYRYGSNKSKFAHVIDEGHAFGYIGDIMKLLHIAKKVSLLDAWEKFFIFKETKEGNQINDKLTVQYNPIFDAVLQ
jgi:hypothetical protein